MFHERSRENRDHRGTQSEDPREKANLVVNEERHCDTSKANSNPVKVQALTHPSCQDSHVPASLAVLMTSPIVEQLSRERGMTALSAGCALDTVSLGLDVTPGTGASFGYVHVCIFGFNEWSGGGRGGFGECFLRRAAWRRLLGGGCSEAEVKACR